METKPPTTIAEVIRKAREDAQPKPPVTTGAAPEKKPIAFKAINVDDHGVIIGIGASIGVDKENESVAKGALIGMSYDFCAAKGAGAREFRGNHDADCILDADLVCTWPGAPILKSGKILEPAAEIPADDEIIGINIEKGNETHWFVGIRPNDPVIVERARKGEVAGFSWGGVVTLTEGA